MPKTAEREIIMTTKKNFIEIKMHEATFVIAAGEHSNAKKSCFDIDTGDVWTGQNDLCEKRNCSKSDVSRAINYRGENGEITLVKGHRYGALSRFSEYAELILGRIRELNKETAMQKDTIADLKHTVVMLTAEIEYLKANPVTVYPANWDKFLKWNANEEKKAELEAVKAAYAQTLREIDDHHITLEGLARRAAELESEIK